MVTLFFSNGNNIHRAGIETKLNTYPKIFSCVIFQVNITLARHIVHFQPKTNHMMACIRLLCLIY